MPTRRPVAGGIRVPDLHLIAEDEWAEVLAPLAEAHLTEAACNPNRPRLLGATPAELARMFVLSGTRRALADQDAANA